MLSGLGFGLVSWEQLFFFWWFQGHNLLGDNQGFKRGGNVKKGRIKYQEGEGSDLSDYHLTMDTKRSCQF